MTATLTRQDTFAHPTDIQESDDDAPDFASFGVSEVATQAANRTDEERLVEFLIHGGHGAAFSNNAGVALAGEDRGWMARGNARGVFADLFHRERMLEYVWWLYQVADPVARNIVNNFTFYVHGGGPAISFVSDNKEKNKERAKSWKKLAKSRAVRWNRTVRASIKATSLFGESFLVTHPLRHPLFEVTDDGRKGSPIATRLDLADRGPRLTVLNSGDIERIIHKPGDPDSVIGYAQRMADGTLRAIDARDVVHVTFDTLPNSVRGHPLLLPVLQQLYQYRAWLSNRHWLNMVRSRVPLVLTRKTGGQAAIRKLQAKFSKLPPPGTVWVLPGGVEATFPDHNIAAPDALADGQQILRTIAMGVNLPEFLVTANAANANYSSSVVAESPAMLMFGDVQDVVETELVYVVCRLLGIPDDDAHEVVVQFPRVERNLKGRVEAFHLGYSDGVVSARTYCEEGVGRPWNGPGGERERLEAEGVSFAPGTTPPARMPPGTEPAEPSAGPKGAEPGTGRSSPPGAAA